MTKTHDIHDHYEDVQLNAVLRRVYTDHKSWVHDQAEEVRDFFDGESLGEDVANAMAMLDYATTDAPEDLQYGFAVAGIYGLLMSVLRVVEMLDDTTVSDVVSLGREVHATVGDKFHRPLKVCGKTVRMLEDMLTAYGYRVSGSMLGDDPDFSRNGTFTVTDADGVDVLHLKHGDYITVALDGSVSSDG